MTDIRLRPARDDDVPGIVTVFLECWTTSYAASLGPRFAATMSASRATELWRAHPIANVVVAVDPSASVVGAVRFDAPVDADPTTAEVHSLYVSPRAQAGGLGGRLLGTAVHAAAEAGCRAARLWVFADNAPSVRFYERRGWIADGRRRVEPEFGLPEQGMTLRLDAGQSAEAAR